MKQKCPRGKRYKEREHFLTYFFSLQGFGAGNFKSLFEAIEKDQDARGNLKILTPGGQTKVFKWFLPAADPLFMVFEDAAKFTDIVLCAKDLSLTGYMCAACHLIK